jgi:c-di-GMP-binding flagellar brake protein YcgR
MSAQGLNKITREKVIAGFIQTAKDKAEEVYVWKITNDRKIMAKVNFDIIRRSKNEIVISPDPSDEEAFEFVIGACEEVNFYLAGTAVMFKAKVKQHLENLKVIISYPSFVAQVERRKSLRLNSYKNGDVRVNFCKTMVIPKVLTQSFNKICFDISMGGFSVLVSKIEAKFFSAGDPIAEATLFIGGRKITTMADVLNVSEIEPGGEVDIMYKVWKVSFRFDLMSKKDQEFINKYVFENSKQLNSVNF